VSSTGSDPPAVCQAIGRSVLAARSAGPLVKPGSASRVARLPRPSAVRARRLNGEESRDARRTCARRVGRSRIGRFGFWVSRAPVCGRPAPAFVFPAAGTSCLGLSPLSGLSGAKSRVSPHDMYTYGRKRTFRRVPPIARSRLSRGRIRSWVYVRSVGLAAGPVSNTELVVCRVAARASTVRRYSETRRPMSPVRR
jgi:hypothetical protein